MVRTDMDPTMTFVIKRARACDPDPGHSAHVARLALLLFDGLRTLHRQGPHERRLLEIAARLHDIGWSKALSGKHHKKSGAMIRKLNIPGLSEKDRRLCALAARYHNKALPDPSRHGRFASLGAGDQAVAEWLAGMLRLADGLDCGHDGAIKNLSCKITNGDVIIHLEPAGNCRAEIAGASRKQDLLLRKLKKDIEYKC